MKRIDPRKLEVKLMRPNQAVEIPHGKGEFVINDNNALKRGKILYITPNALKLLQQVQRDAA